MHYSLLTHPEAYVTILLLIGHSLVDVRAEGDGGAVRASLLFSLNSIRIFPFKIWREIVFVLQFGDGSVVFMCLYGNAP